MGCGGVGLIAPGVPIVTCCNFESCMWEKAVFDPADTQAQAGAASPSESPAPSSNLDRQLTDPPNAGAPSASSHLALVNLPVVERVPLSSKQAIRQVLTHPMITATTGEFPLFGCPRCWNDLAPFATMAGAPSPSGDTAIADFQTVFDINWRKIDPLLADVNVVSWKLTFYQNEVDSNPPSFNKPRLDILLTTSNGEHIRWHPDAKIIRCDGTVTPAMQQRMNRRNKLLRRLQLQ
jgi:hypothetical protein